MRLVLSEPGRGSGGERYRLFGIPLTAALRGAVCRAGRVDDAIIIRIPRLPVGTR